MLGLHPKLVARLEKFGHYYCISLLFAPSSLRISCCAIILEPLLVLSELAAIGIVLLMCCDCYSCATIEIARLCLVLNDLMTVIPCGGLFAE